MTYTLESIRRKLKLILINYIHIKSNAKLYNTRSVLIKGDSNKKNLEDGGLNTGNLESPG